MTEALFLWAYITLVVVTTSVMSATGDGVITRRVTVL
jgi:hypothetical protein